MQIITSTSTETLIKCFYKVYNTLGYGFLEKVYEKAFILELRKQGIECAAQVPINVFYDDQLIGEYYADILVNQEIILELKTSVIIADEHEAQLLNYLKATKIEVGYLFSFGKKPEFKRKVFSH